MKYEPHPTSKVASMFRANYTVFQLERMQRVSGQAFAISGDAPARAKARERKRKMEHSGHYGKEECTC